MAEESSQNWSIRALSVELEHPLALGAVHNVVAIYNDKQQPVLVLQGFAVDRHTGKIEDFSVDAQNSTLRAVVTDGKNLDQLETVSDVLLFEGGQPEIMEKAFHMMEAAEFINKQNLPYVFADVVQASQNSNSVFRTFIESAGLEYTEELENLFAPGDGRILLPENWEPSVQFATLDPDTVTKEQVQKIEERILEIIDNLKRQNVVEQVIEDPAPEAMDADSLYFDRAPAPDRPAFGSGDVLLDHGVGR